MLFDIKARVRHLLGVHTAVLDVRAPGRWCYVCGKRL
jgi:hypothetical protein